MRNPEFVVTPQIPPCWKRCRAAAADDVAAVAAVAVAAEMDD